MPRSKSGLKRSPVDSESLTIAAKKCINAEMSMCEAASRFQVSKTTLARHVNAFRKSGATEFKYAANNNTKQVFSQEEEESLKDYLLTAARLHYSLSKAEVRRLAYQFAFANTEKYPESWITEKIAGKEWLRHFLKRHPDLVLKMRKPGTTFLNNLKELLATGNFLPEKIWNCDETCLGEGGQNITMIAAVSAFGSFIPPMLIFPETTFKLNMLKGCPVGSIGCANPSGLSNVGLFLRFLAHFVNHNKPNKQDPVILTLDNHEGHVSIEAIRFCQESGVILLTFDPFGSHKKQPLDRIVFKSMKSYYGTAYHEWMLKNPSRTITITDMAELIGIAFPKAFTASNIQEGFEETGLSDVYENIFTDPEISGMESEVDETMSISAEASNILEKYNNLHSHL